MRGGVGVFCAAFFATICVAVTTGDAVARERCEQRSPAVFIIEGRLDEAMAACVAERLQTQTEEVILTSAGGDVAAALDIAERFAGRTLTMRVRGECNSSCANYLVPMASRLIVERGAVMLLHGGIDSAFVARLRIERDEIIAEHRAEGLSIADAEMRYDEALRDAQANADRQSAFAQQHGVRLGWLIYREEAQPTTSHFLSGATDPSLAGNRFVLVEEALIRSCLPRVEVEPYQADLEAHWFGRRWARLRERGIVRSATLSCDEPS